MCCFFLIQGKDFSTYIRASNMKVITLKFYYVDSLIWNKNYK